MDHNEWLKQHVLIDPDGEVVEPGTTLLNHRQEPMVYRKITRAPGDGTSTNGKILADLEGWPNFEGYPPAGYRIVQRWSAMY